MGRQQEIIEIGAVRLDAYGRHQNSFQKFIKPARFPSLSVYCKKLTGISQLDIDSARGFKYVGGQFIDWIQSEDEEYRLCSWGGKDQTLLVSDCLDAGLDQDWLDPYLDLKVQYHHIHGLQRKLGLKKCLLREGLEFEGSHHRALDDARNLVELFVRYLDVWVY